MAQPTLEPKQNTARTPSTTSDEGRWLLLLPLSPYLSGSIFGKVTILRSGFKESELVGGTVTIGVSFH